MAINPIVNSDFYLYFCNPFISSKLPVLQTPRKITPDNLKDALVVFKIVSDAPDEALPGLFYSLLKSNFREIPRESNPDFWSFGGSDGVHFEKREIVQFTSGNVKIQVIDNVLSFNLIGPYPGWNAYFPCIKEVLKHGFEAGYIQGVERIGLRYISELAGLSIFSSLKQPLVFLFPGGEGLNNTFKSELFGTDYTVVLNLADNIVRRSVELGAENFSLVDVDVFHQYSSPLQNIDLVLAETNRLHIIEKDVFFGILAPKFVQSRQPEY